VIYGKVGRLGHGKTMRAVVDGLDLVKLRGVDRTWLASNITIRAPEGVTFRLLPMDGFSERLAALILEVRERGVGLVVVLDEIDTIWDPHAWQDVRRTDRYRIKQSRKDGIDLFWTAQFVDMVEKSVRNITEEVELVRAYPSPTIRRREAGKRPWVIRGQRFRPGAVRDLQGSPDKDQRLSAKWHRYDRAHELLYDTDELVLPPPIDQGDLCARHKKERSEQACPMCAVIRAAA
jgi:Zonular occludens toxin (Zot)